MKHKTLFVLIPSILLMSCSMIEDDDHDYSHSSISDVTSTTSISSSSSSNSDDSSSISGSNDSSSSTSASSDSTTHSNTADTNTSITTGATDDDDEWKQGRQILDCGFYAMDLPKNASPINIPTSNSSSDWQEFDMKENMPTNYRYIYKNACDDGPSGHHASPSFYSYNSSKPKDYPGGLKIAMPGVGFQSPLFSHTGYKLELRFGISQVNNCNDSVTHGDVAHVYFFNSSGGYLGKYVFAEGSVTVSTAGNYLQCYWENNASNVAYFEFRVNQKPFKGSQVYNIGIGYCNIKSWQGSN